MAKLEFYSGLLVFPGYFINDFTEVKASNDAQVEAILEAKLLKTTSSGALETAIISIKKKTAPVLKKLFPDTKPTSQEVFSTFC